MSRFIPKPAVRKGQKARVALAGPSGSGKTWTGLETALTLADGLPVLVCDTERGSASLYADFYTFDVIEWDPPYDPRELAEVLAEMGGKYGAILVDSLSHFWEGEGGTRDIVDAAAARSRGNSFAGWKEGTPAQNDMVAALLNAPCHIVATMRSKTEYVLEPDDRGRQVPRKVGMAPVQRAGIEYEFTVTAELDMEHTLLIDKSRCSTISGRAFKQGHTVDFATELRDWLNTAEPALSVSIPTNANQVSSEPMASPENHQSIRNLIESLTDEQRPAFLAWWKLQNLPGIKTQDALTCVEAEMVFDHFDGLSGGGEGDETAPGSNGHDSVNPPPDFDDEGLPEAVAALHQAGMLSPEDEDKVKTGGGPATARAALGAVRGRR